MGQILCVVKNGADEQSRGLEGSTVQGLEALAGQQNESEPDLVQEKLAALFAEHPWMVEEQAKRDLAKIVRENTSVRLKRRKVIAIANRMTAALSPYVACKAGCNHCCHMNTMIYEHEAIRLAEVTGQKMVRLPPRPMHEVIAAGHKFNGTPCTFLVEGECSVYDDRPMVCRTHHSLRENAALCSMDIPASEYVRPPMYDADILETPYMELSQATNSAEPWGNIAEFFPC